MLIKLRCFKILITHIVKKNVSKLLPVVAVKSEMKNFGSQVRLVQFIFRHQKNRYYTSLQDTGKYRIQ